jgi:hypothetical protein
MAQQTSCEAMGGATLNVPSANPAPDRKTTPMNSHIVKIQDLVHGAGFVALAPQR